MKKRIIFSEFKLTFYVPDGEKFEACPEYICNSYQIFKADDIAVSYSDGSTTVIVTWTFGGIKQKTMFSHTPIAYTEIKPE